MPGEAEALQGYITGVKFLLYINHYYINVGLEMDLGDSMVVVGGGNVAMDCVRSALRLGVKDVHVVYRRTRGGHARRSGRGGGPPRRRASTSIS